MVTKNGCEIDVHVGEIEVRGHSKVTRYQEHTMKWSRSDGFWMMPLMLGLESAALSGSVVIPTSPNSPNPTWNQYVACLQR